MNTMNSGIELDEEMISVSPIYKSTPPPVNGNNNKPNDPINRSPDGPNNNSPPSVLGSSPPSMIRRSPPTLKHQHSYAGHEEEMNKETNTVGSVPRVSAPSGRPFLATRHLSIEEYIGASNGNSNVEHQATAPSRNNSLPGRTTDHPFHQQRVLFHSPTTNEEMSVNSQEMEEEEQQQRQQPSLGSSHDDNIDDDDDDGQEEEEEETAEERARREEEESIALAQMLMAEEAVASHRMSADFLRMNSDQFSAEDFAALQDALREEEDVEYDESAAAAAEEVEEDLSYDALLRLGDAIGDVKTDRWTKIAQKEIDKLETFQYKPKSQEETTKSDDDNNSDTKMVDVDDSELKCLICQFAYEEGDGLRRLPCGHCFHKECIDQWLLAKDCCAYCRQCIIPEDDKKGAQN